MGTWKDFITEIPIVNKKAEGIFVKADHVLDLWAERNQLREEVARLKAGEPAVPADAPVAAEPEVAVVPVASAPRESAIREQCAREIEELAATYPCDAALQGFVATVDPIV
jgi:chorismate mutase